MDHILYYESVEGISLERMERTGKFNMQVNHFHNEYEIFYLLKGDRQFFFRNRAYHVTSGSLILVDENVIHMTRAFCEDETGHDRMILYIGKDKMRQLEAKFPNLNLVRFFKEHYGVYNLTPLQQEDFMHLYQNLCSEFDGKCRNYKAMLEMHILQYFIHFMRENHTPSSFFNSVDSATNHKYQTIYEIADYLTDHFSENITLDSLGKHFFLSKYFLSRTFKEVSGYGVTEYVNLLRIQQAKRLLEETGMAIGAIADAVGYDSTTYFEKVFKRYMTLSPLKYRKTLNTVTYTNEIPAAREYPLNPKDQESPEAIHSRQEYTLPSEALRK